MNSFVLHSPVGFWETRPTRNCLQATPPGREGSLHYEKENKVNTSSEDGVFGDSERSSAQQD